MVQDTQKGQNVIVLDFGGAPKESFSALVEVDDVPEYSDAKEAVRLLQLTKQDEVQDDGTALFKAFGLI